MTASNEGSDGHAANHVNPSYENRDMHTPSISRKRPSTSCSSSRSHREFQIVTPSQQVGVRRQHPFPPLTEPRPSTLYAGSENIWPPPCSTSPFVTPGAGANIGRRRRANAISLADSPSRRGHSQAMAKIFEDAHKAVEAQNQFRNSRLYSHEAVQEIKLSGSDATPKVSHGVNEPDSQALGTVRVKRPKRIQDQGNLLLEDISEGLVSTHDNDDNSYHNSFQQQQDVFTVESSDEMPPNEIKTWLEGIFEYRSEQTTEHLSSSLSYTLNESDTKYSDTSPSPSGSTDKENHSPTDNDLSDQIQNPSPSHHASCLSTLLKSAPRRGKIQAAESSATPVSLATRWRPAMIPIHRGRSSKRSDSMGTGQLHAKSAVLTENAKVVVEDDSEGSKLCCSSGSSSEEFVDARTLPYSTGKNGPSYIQAAEKLRVDSNATTAVERQSLPSRSPSASRSGLASALAIKVEKRKSSPQDSEELHTVLSDPSASARLLEASGIQRAPSYSFPSPGAGSSSTYAGKKSFSPRSRVLTPEVQKFRKGKGPEKPRCPSYYDEDLEETTPRRSARIAKK